MTTSMCNPLNSWHDDRYMGTIYCTNAIVEARWEARNLKP
jgi:hypothetical protein